MPRTPLGLEKPKGRKYRSRLTVPEELRQIMGKKEFVQTLGTHDFNTAIERHELEMLKFRNEIAAARRHLGQTTQLNELRAESIQAILYEWLHQLEKASFEECDELFESASRGEVMQIAEGMYENLEELSEETKEASKNLNARYSKRPTLSQREADKILELHAIDFDYTSSHYDRFRRLVARGILENYERKIALLSGSDRFRQGIQDRYFMGIDAEQSLKLRSSRDNLPKQKVTIDQLVDSKLEEKSHLSDETKNRYRNAADAFAEFVGHGTDISTITREHFINFKNLLLKVPSNARKRFKGLTLEETAKLPDEVKIPLMKIQTVRQYINDLSMFWEHAVILGWVSRNHAKQVAPSKTLTEKQETAEPFTVDQLKTIFTAPLYTGCIDAERNFNKVGSHVIKRWRFWIPLIALFSGIRQNEICQLYVSDIKEELGIQYFNVHIEGDDGQNVQEKRIKNRSSFRKVPIHPELIEMGFLDYVNSVKNDGHERVFPELPFRNNRYSSMFQKRFATFLKAIGLKSSRAECFHSFRNNFKDAAVRAGLSIEYYGRIGGWAEAKGSSKDYGNLSVQDLHQAICKIRYEGLDLSHLKA